MAGFGFVGQRAGRIEGSPGLAIEWGHALVLSGEVVIVGAPWRAEATGDRFELLISETSACGAREGAVIRAALCRRKSSRRSSAAWLGEPNRVATIDPGRFGAEKLCYVRLFQLDL